MSFRRAIRSESRPGTEYPPGGAQKSNNLHIINTKQAEICRIILRWYVLKDLLARGEELPDIITCRRFSLNDAAPLSDHLMDLSQTEVAGTFYSSYLEVNREPGGAIRWLPMCAEVDSIMANKDLFDQYNIPLPTNYSQFLAAIDAFEAVGIKGFQTDWYYDHSCLETIQSNDCTP